MNNEVSISVVMASFNGEKFIAEAIDSILNQTFKDFEFIIVNDGSSDSTESIITSFSDPRIVYLKKSENTGIADSLNLGIETAKGKYIARMDDDDISYPLRLLTQFKFLEENAEYILCASNVNLTDNSKNKFFVEQVHEELKMKLLFFNPIVHPSVMLRSEIFKTIRYDPSKPPSEDYDLWSRMIILGKFVRLSTPLLLYRANAQSETTLRRKEQFQLNVWISERVFETLGFIINEKDKHLHSALISHDYTVDFRELPKLLAWLDSLMDQNTTRNLFATATFDEMIADIKGRYLLSYFTNNNRRVKIKAFKILKPKEKFWISSYYIKELME